MGACVPSFIRFETNLNKNTSHENKKKARGRKETVCCKKIKDFINY